MKLSSPFRRVALIAVLLVASFALGALARHLRTVPPSGSVGPATPHVLVPVIVPLFYALR